MTLPARFWMPENPQGKPYVTTGPLAAPPYVECVRVDSLDGWRDIETSPKDDIDVLVGGDFSYVGGVVMAKHITDYPRPTFSDMDGDLYYPTHWMPLPPPPKQNKPHPFSEYGNYRENNPPVMSGPGDKDYSC